jgi:predicted  nucleic acid-binding Zn-ribbon protein
MLAELQQEVSDLRASSESTKTLETRLHFLEEEKRQLQSANSFIKEDLKSANDMIEKLKETLRTMSGKDEAFFDTFEGVMREEMMAMKAAFEAKLRAAKEETNALSRKHFEDIKKMKTDLTTPLGRARMGVSSQGLGMSATSTATTTSFASMNTTGTGIGVGAGAGASTTSGGYGPGRSAI